MSEPTKRTGLEVAVERLLSLEAELKARSILDLAGVGVALREITLLAGGVMMARNEVEVLMRMEKTEASGCWDKGHLIT